MWSRYGLDAAADVPFSFSRASDLGIKMGRLRGFARGGEPRVGRMALVGERGPELIMPKTPVRVISNEDMGRIGGGGNVTINVNADFAVDLSNEHQSDVAAGQDVAVAVRQIIAEDISRGGLVHKALQRSYGAQRRPTVAR